MSAILVEFMDGGDYGSERSKTYIPGPLFRTRQDQKFVRAYLKDAAKYGIKDGVELRATAYGQDIREIKNTTNDSDLISKIEKAIKELDESMFDESGKIEDNISVSEGLGKGLQDSSVFKEDSSEQDDSQLED